MAVIVVRAALAYGPLVSVALPTLFGGSLLSALAVNSRRHSASCPYNCLAQRAGCVRSCV
jgi:hypothetical protein